MFLISKKQSVCQSALEKFIKSVQGVRCGPINLVYFSIFSLAWSRTKCHENLHVFNDGIIIGKLGFSEEPCDTIITHDMDLPQRILPLSTGLRIKISETSCIVEPFNITNIYYGKECVSDMQLLIAAAEGQLPNYESVSVFTAMGYLPGNMTLFSDIQKIPFLSSFDLISHRISNPQQLNYESPDDDRLVERLAEVVPSHPLQYLGMSAGYDSRFILGILRKTNTTPNLINIDCDETDLVKRISDQLRIPLTVVSDHKVHLFSPKAYTLLTDAQIYLRGGNYSGARSYLNSNSLYHTGIFSGPIIKKVYGKATKFLFTKNSLYSNLVEYVSLSNCDNVISGLSRPVHKRDIHKFLLGQLEFGNNYCSFKNKKEWANWFCYLHEAIRWGQAHFADLSYFSQPVFLLSDLPATMLGISSKASDNYLHNRVRRMNNILLPELTVPYNYGGGFLPKSGVLGEWEKLRSEYVNRDYISKYLFHIPDRSELVFSKSKTIDEKIEINPSLFSYYFSESIEHIVQDTTCSYTLKRAAVTIGCALEYLESK